MSKALHHAGRATLLAVAMLQALAHPRTWLRATFEEAYRQASGSLPLVIFLSILGGAILSQQTGVQFEGGLPNWVIGAIVGAGLVTELVPLFVAFALVGIVGARITAELATMQVTEQIDALEVIGRDPIPFLVVPRVLGGLFAGLVLVSVGLGVGMVGGWVFAIIATPASTAEFWYGVKVWGGDFHYFFALFKGLAFGGTVSFLACYVGLEARGGSMGVGRATTQAVVAVICAVIVVDALMVPLLRVVSK